MFLTFLTILIIFFSFLAGVAFMPIHSILSMLLAYICSGILFLFLGLEFIGLIYIVVYAGAVVILFIFVLMLTNQPYRIELKSMHSSLFLTVCTVGLLFCIKIFNMLFITDLAISKRTIYSTFLIQSDLDIIGQSLYSFNYVYVIFIAIALFIALVSVVICTSSYKNTYVSKRITSRIYKHKSYKND